MFGNKVYCMIASKKGTDSLLSSIVPKLWSFAYRLARDERAAERLVQQACEHWLDQRRCNGDSRSTLITILACMQAIWLADASRCSQPAADKDRPCGARGSRNAEYNAGALTFLPADGISAIQNLPPLPRVAMLLVHAEGLSYLEAAEVIGIPVTDIQHLILEARLTIGSWAGVVDRANGSSTIMNKNYSSESR
jgi:RNA polymerase sigma-70 factor, ECF subfamily